MKGELPWPETVILWIFRGLIAIFSTVLLSQLATGWFGWRLNVPVLVIIGLSAFGMGVLEFEGRET